MNPAQKKLNNRYYKALAEFDNCNRKAKQLKQEMARIRQQITPSPQLVDERPDELNLKS